MLDKLVIIGLSSLIVGYGLGLINRYIRQVFYTIFAGIVFVALFLFPDFSFNTTIMVLGFKMHFIFDVMSWFFFLLIWGAGFFIYLFSLSMVKVKSENKFYFLLQTLLVISSFVVISRDMISFYISWELMSLLIVFLAFYKKSSRKAGIQYFAFSLFGAYSLLIGFLLLYKNLGSIDFTFISQNMAQLSYHLQILILSLLSVPFIIKGAVMPGHVWLPELHSKAHSEFSPFLSGIIVKYAFIGFFLLFFVLFKDVIQTPFRIVLAYLAGITMLIGSFSAVFQNSAKRLLAYSTMANVSYSVVAIAVGGNMGFYGGTFHLINHAVFQTLLFLIVAGIVYRTGTDNLNELGGLIKTMPASFIAMLIAIIASAGVPPMNAYVSKWMIYSSLFNSHQYVLMILMLISSTVAFLYLYRLIHGIFLGQIQPKHMKIKELPLPMLVSMGILTLTVLLTGPFAGSVLHIVDKLAVSFGVAQIPFTLTSITMGTSVLQTSFVSLVFVGSFAFMFLLFVVLPGRKRVSQYDNYNSGQVLKPEQKYHYTSNFYKPFYRSVGGWSKIDFFAFYHNLSSFWNRIVGLIKYFYSGDLQYYIILVVIFLITILSIWWF